MPQKERQYCLFMDGRKYDRNPACKRHDKAYGIKGGGDGRARLAADRAMRDHMRQNGDPLAGWTYDFLRGFGWVFFNYHGRPWSGQLIRKFYARY